MKKVSLLLFVLVLLLGGCKKLVIDAESGSDYVGEWYGWDDNYNYAIGIYSDGTAKYQREGDNLLTRQGKARMKGDILKVAGKKFTINQSPVLDSLGWSMVLDDITFYR